MAHECSSVDIPLPNPEELASSSEHLADPIVSEGLEHLKSTTPRGTIFASEVESAVRTPEARLQTGISGEILTAEGRDEADVDGGLSS